MEKDLIRCECIKKTLQIPKKIKKYIIYNIFFIILIKHVTDIPTELAIIITKLFVYLVETLVRLFHEKLTP